VAKNTPKKLNINQSQGAAKTNPPTHRSIQVETLAGKCFNGRLVGGKSSE